jgi:hypothetical protein
MEVTWNEYGGSDGRVRLHEQTSLSKNLRLF